MTAQKSDETNWPSTADEDWVSQCYAGPLHTRQRDAQRFQASTILERHIPNLMAPNSWVVHISSEEPGYWRSREKLDFFATIVSSGEAWLAFVADNVRFDGYTISNFEMFHRWVYGQDDSRRFVSKYVGISNNHRTDAASVPEVNIGSEG